MLRIGPKIFVHTILANATEEKMKAMAQSCYDEPWIKIVVGGDIAFQSMKGTKKLNMSA
jgi:hypothetical protein